MGKRPSLRALAIYLDVVEGATMTAAAERAHMSQPAVSTRIKELERFYGTPLLERRGRQVVPTATGRMVARYAGRILGLVDELADMVADLEGLRRGKLWIGASASVGETLLPDVIGRFRRAYPAIEVELQIGNSDQILHAVRHRELPFGIVGVELIDDDLESRPVIHDRLDIFAATDSPLRERASLRVADLLDETFVLREPGSATRELALSHLAALGVVPSRSVQFGSNEAVKRAVSSGLGIGILSTHTLAVDLRAGVLEVLPCLDWHCRRRFWFVRRRDRPDTQVERAFCEVLQRTTA